MAFLVEVSIGHMRGAYPLDALCGRIRDYSIAAERGNSVDCDLHGHDACAP